MDRQSLFITQHFAILEVCLPGTAQIINKKEVWLAFQGNNEGRCGRLQQTQVGTETNQVCVRLGQENI